MTETDIIRNGASFALYNDSIKSNCIKTIESLETKGILEVTIKPISKDKTLKQLGALFGLWIKYISEQTGESEDLIHKRLKAQFLARIYYVNPQNLEQHNWLEACSLYQERGDQEKLKAKANDISLSWATVGQMQDYMDAIQNHHVDIGNPLPIPDKFYKVWQNKRK